MFSHFPFLFNQDIKKWKLADPRTFHYLNQSQCIDLERMDDSKEYNETRKAIDVVGINSEEQVGFFFLGHCFGSNYGIDI